MPTDSRRNVGNQNVGDRVRVLRDVYRSVGVLPNGGYSQEVTLYAATGQTGTVIETARRPFRHGIYVQVRMDHDGSIATLRRTSVEKI